MSRRTTLALSTTGLLAAGAALAALASRPARRDVPEIPTASGGRRPVRVIIAGGGYVGFCTARQLRARLKEAVAREEYEKAAEYRDRIRSLESRMEEQSYGS